MTILEEYKNWIKENKSVWYELKENEEGCFRLKANNACAEVNFYELEVLTCELKILDANDENLFYLHFELKDLSHAQGLYNEMIDSLRKIKEKKQIEALLCCSSGLTTSFFTMKLNDAAELLSMDIHFEAEGYSELYNAAVDKDVILLAPQIGYLYQQVKDILKDKIVLQIPGAVFARYDTGTMLNMIKEEFEARQKKSAPVTEEPEHNEVTIRRHGEWGTFMVIAYVNNRNNLSVNYRVCQECTILEDRTYIKEKWGLDVFEDILDTVLPRYPEVENVYIATPGTINKGRLSNDYLGVVDVDIVQRFTDKYHRKFNLCNDHNAITMGYYADHAEELGDFVLFYQAYLNHAGGAGIILDGKLRTGYNHYAGEVHFMLRSLHFSDPYHYLSRTPEGQAELTAKQMLPLILSIGPDTIGFCNPMVQDVEAVENILAHYIPKRLLPKIIKVDDEIENLYWGAMLIGRSSIHTNYED